MFTTALRFLKDDSGATAIEYALIAGLVSIAAITALGTVGTEIVDIFTTIGTKLATASTP